MDEIFKSLSDINRRKIITLLVKNGPMNVSAIVTNLSIGQSTTSNHLRVLKKAGLVDCLINNKERIYKINAEKIIYFIKTLNNFFGNLEVRTSPEIIIRRK